MIDSILQLDRVLFDWINQGWSSDILDVVLPFMRNRKSWIPLYIVCIVWILYRYRLTSWIPLLAIAITMTLSDTVSSKLIKKTIKRPRPCHVIDAHPQTILRVHCGGGYSFTSSHATNHFTLAIILPILLGFKKRWINISCIVWAALIAISQVYVGVHYPFDIFCGMLLGIAIGGLTRSMYVKYGYPKVNDALQAIA